MWQFWIDVGGTFTDCIGLSPDGSEHLAKVLSSAMTKGRFVGGEASNKPLISSEIGAGIEFWSNATVRKLDESTGEFEQRCVVAFDQTCGEFELDQPFSQVTGPVELDLGLHAPIVAIRRILKLGLREAIPDCRVHLGTTRGTNALLTRRGARTALVTSRGFRDLLRIGDQARPHLFQLAITKPATLFETSIELDERVLADGTVERRPSEMEVRQQLGRLLDEGIESIAICFIHGYRYPEHEEWVGKIARTMGFADVRLSHEVAPLIKMVSRGETTVLDAYLNPVIGRYLNEIQQQLSSDSQLRLMTSYGGLVSRSRFSGKDSVLSGPAGGVVGAARVAQAAGFDRAITFDMGGTSTDVGRFDGEFELDYETKKAGVRIVSPMVAIETVAAGGGSICRFDGSKLVVGPDSATSDPGPACYGNQGPLTVTDINLFLGRLVPEHFPFELDEAAVHVRLDEICQGLVDEFGIKMNPLELAIGFLKIANHNMAAAIRDVSVAKGYDPKEYVLVSFGGAGSQHSCGVARTLGIRKIVDHPHGSILSAVGIRMADQTATRVRSILQKLDGATLELCKSSFEEMTSEIREELHSEVGEQAEIEFSCSLDLRYQGTESFETINESAATFESDFARVHQQRYGYIQNRPLEVVAARVTGRIAGNRLQQTEWPVETRVARSDSRQKIYVVDELNNEAKGIEVEVFDRESLKTGDQIIGPAIIFNKLTTTMVDPGWQATRLAEGQLLVEYVQSDGPNVSGKNDGSVADPVQLEIFNNHFSSIARQMGIVLQKTSTSVNVKDRLDFSCAVFNGDGELVVNAPHIPVHLGAMSHTVRATIADNPVVNPGDVWVTNDPYRGGSHLPDITVVTPVFVDSHAVPEFWVASRSHHAEIGGKSPGSMPADATCLEEEGVLIQNFKLIDAGQDRFDELRTLLSAGKFPSRSPDENIADLAAQVAANRCGELDLRRLVEQHSVDTVRAYMGHIQEAAYRKVCQALEKMPDGEFAFSDSMDVEASTIQLAISKRGRQLRLDFSGTSPVLGGNLNANPAIVSAAVMYVMRCLIDEDIPLNEGVMKPVEVVIPDCFLNPTPSQNPAGSPAIVGGNVETSQRVVDVILGALGIAAASQGTMNNWLMGDESFGYYETVCGGSGATSSNHGASAVHTHMTNTRLTDPEILETRYPAILREFSIRAGSGGEGANQGGDGICRRVEFTRDVILSLLTSRRQSQPFGLNGGSPGASGKNRLIKSNGEEVELPSQCSLEVRAGDRLELLTPGGGGFGRVED